VCVAACYPAEKQAVLHKMDARFETKSVLFHSFPSMAVFLELWGQEMKKRRHPAAKVLCKTQTSATGAASLYSKPALK
jgi:hypothetical protein